MLFSNRYISPNHLQIDELDLATVQDAIVSQLGTDAIEVRPVITLIVTEEEVDLITGLIGPFTFKIIRGKYVYLFYASFLTFISCTNSFYCQVSMAGDVSIADLETLVLNYLGTVPKRTTTRELVIESVKVQTLGR